jgi:hypothetical protein
MTRRLFAGLLVIALLGGWQAALQHPIEHVDERGWFVHLDDGRSPEGSSVLCDVLNALTACAPDATPALLVSEHPAHRLQPQYQRAPRIADAPPFLSQGPPKSV